MNNGQPAVMINNNQLLLRDGQLLIKTFARCVSMLSLLTTKVYFQKILTLVIELPNPSARK